MVEQLQPRLFWIKAIHLIGKKFPVLQALLGTKKRSHEKNHAHITDSQ